MTAADVARVVAERDLILSSPELRRTPGLVERYLLPLFRQVVEWFDGLSGPVYWTVTVSLVLVLGALFVHMFVSLSRQAAGASGRSGPGQGIEAARGRHDADALAGEARQALSEGSFTKAVRLAWLCALARLEAAGVSPAHEGRADWEHVADVRRRRGEVAAGEVGALATAFQRTRFGGDDADAAVAGRCMELLAALERRLVVGGD